MKKLLPIILMLFSVTTFAQNTATTIWTAAFGLQDTVLRIPTAVDPARYVYVAGSTIDSATGANILLQKYDPWGNPLWTASYTGTGYHRDQATTIDIDANYNIIVGGFTYTNSTNNYDYLVLKYDSAGTLLWTYTYNGIGSGADLVSALTISSNNIYLTGASIGSSTLFDYATIKLNSSGVVQWNNQYNYLGADIPFDIDISGSNVFVNGGSQSSITDWDYAQVTYSTSGTAIDTIRTTGTGVGFDHATQAVTDAQGYVYITGTYASLSNGLDYKTIKLDQQGNIKWISTFNGTGNNNDVANSVGVDYYGNVYVTGYSENSAGNDDYCTIKYDSTGTQQWIRYYNNSYHDRANKLIVGDDNNVYITGESSNSNNKDFATIGYNESGDTLWTIRYNGIYNSDDMATNIEKHDGYVYVSGQSKVSATTYQYVTIAYGEATYETIPDPFNEEPGNTWFYPNLGQVANSDGIPKSRVTYYSQNQSPSIYLNKSTASYVFNHHDNDTATADTIQRVDMDFMDNLGDTIKQDIYEVDKGSEHYLNFYLPQCPNGIVDVAGFKTTFIEDLYKGIDLYYTSNAAGPKHYFVLNKGQSPSNINMWFRGADSISHSLGKYNIHTSVGALKFDSLVAYEIDASGAIIPNTMQPLDIYADTINGYWHFVPFTYNESNTLVIMAKKNMQQSIYPENLNMGWSTYWGQGLEDEFVDIKVDNDGFQYIGGNTYSALFPVGSGASIGNYVNNQDAIIIKVNDQEVPTWLTFFGGAEYDKLKSIAVNNVDYNGQLPPPTSAIYGVGYTYSTDLVPVGPVGSFLDDVLEDMEMMIFKLDADGYLEWFTSYGYAGDDIANDIAVDGNNNIYIVGATTPEANNHLVYEAGATTVNNLVDPENARTAFILKFTEDNELIWASYVISNSGSGSKNATSVTIDLFDNSTLNHVYVAGYTDVFTPRGLNVPIGDPSNDGNYDLFVTKYELTDAYAWGKLLDGNEADIPTDLTVDLEGDVYGVGYTYSTNLPQVQYDPTSTDDFSLGGGTPGKQALIYKIDGTTGDFKWLTYYGGEGEDVASHIAISNPIVFVSGYSKAQDIQFPVAPYLEHPAGYYVFDYHNDSDLGLETNDGFLLAFNSHCDLQWTTYFGQNVYIEYSDDKINAIDCSTQNGKLYFCGSSNGYGQKQPHNEVIPLHDFDPTSIADYFQENSNSENRLEGFVGYFDPLLIENTNGLNEKEISRNLSIYPNPAQEVLNINYLSKVTSNAKVIIYNAVGEVVYSTNQNLSVGRNQLSYPTKQLSKGLYFISIQSDKETINKKFTKN